MTKEESLAFLNECIEEVKQADPQKLKEAYEKTIEKMDKK